MTETFVTFNGASASVEDAPDMALGDRVDFNGYGECIRVATEKRADGEQRPVITIKVAEVDLGQITKAPEKDDQLPFEDDTATEDGDDN